MNIKCGDKVVIEKDGIEIGVGRVVDVNPKELTYSVKTHFETFINIPYENLSKWHL